MSIKTKLAKLERELDNMDPDDPRYEALNAEANQLAAEIDAVEVAYAKELEARALKEREENLRRRIGEKFGNYTDWLKWAESLYDITPDFTVVSKARDWEEEKSWCFSDRISCLEKIEQLIYWKEYDHFRRQ